MIVRDPKGAISIGRKVLADERISDATIGFYCRLMLKVPLENNVIPPQHQEYLEELIKYGYARNVNGEFLINEGW